MKHHLKITGLDHDPKAVEMYEANVDRAITCDLRQYESLVRAKTVQKPDMILASPPTGIFENPEKYHGDPNEEDLLPAIVGIIMQSRPRVFLIECPQEVMEVEGGSYMRKLYRTLWGKYWVDMQGVHAVSHGVPYMRSRAYIVGIQRTLWTAERFWHGIPWPRISHRPPERTETGSLFGEDLPIWRGRHSVLSTDQGNLLPDMPSRCLNKRLDPADMIRMQTLPSWHTPDNMTKQDERRLIRAGTPYAVGAKLGRMLAEMDPDCREAMDLCCGGGLLSYGIFSGYEASVAPATEEVVAA